MGTISITENDSKVVAEAKAKVVRVKDGEVLGIAKENKVIKENPVAKILFDEVLNLLFPVACYGVTLCAKLRA